MSKSLDEELELLRRSSRKQLTDRWRELYRAAPPAALTPDLIARGIAWRLQERALGGLSNRAHAALSAGDELPRRRILSRTILRPGNRLVRRWRGRTYVVDVTDAGLIYEGMQHSSLSIIANEITGTRWSGPKFFGLVK